MFEIRYRIVENVETLQHITPEVFDKDFRDFAGQIELSFDGNKIGYVYEEEISEEMFKVGCFQDQWLLWWFTDLIKAVKLLRLNNYLAFSVPECPNWIEFIKSDNCIRVQELREIPYYTIANFKLASIPEMSTKPPVVEILLDTGETYSKDIQMEPTNFAESIISHMEFEQEIETSSKMLLDEIKKCFPNLVNTQTIRNFEEMIITLNKK